MSDQPERRTYTSEDFQATLRQVSDDAGAYHHALDWEIVEAALRLAADVARRIPISDMTAEQIASAIWPWAKQTVWDGGGSVDGDFMRQEIAAALRSYADREAAAIRAALTQEPPPPASPPTG
jgi:hypothetical protein